LTFWGVVAGLLALALPNAQAPSSVRVRIETSLGNIDIAVDVQHAPITAANFLKYVDGHYYDGGQFYRAARGVGGQPAAEDAESRSADWDCASLSAQVGDRRNRIDRRSAGQRAAVPKAAVRLKNCAER